VSDTLADLVSCERYRGSFPAGMPRRACLRRQLEQKREWKGWAPVRPACAACPLGGAVRGEVERAGVALGTCSGCGAALVGETVCEPCAATTRSIAGPRVYGEPCPGCGSVSNHKANCSRPPRPARGGRARRHGPAAPAAGARPHVPLAGPVLVSTRIWGPDAPDAPIASGRRHDVGLTAAQVAEAAERVREAMKHPTRVATPGSGATRRADKPPESRENDAETRTNGASRGAPITETPAPQAQQHARRAEPPAQPAQETTMPAGLRSTPCPGCGTKGSKHRQVDGKDCPERAKGPHAAAEKPKAGPATKKAPPPKPTRAPRAKPSPAQGLGESTKILPTSELSDEELAKSIAACRAEIQKRKLDARARVEKLEEIERAVSEAA
jgi:hypothetical protein